MTDIEAAEFAAYLRDERERRRARDVRTWSGGMYRRAMMRAYAESIGVDRERALDEFEAPAAPPAAPPNEARDLAVPPARLSVEPQATAAAPRAAVMPRSPVFSRRPAASPRRVPAGATALALFVVAAGIIWSVAGSDSERTVGVATPAVGTAQAMTAAPQAVNRAPQAAERTPPAVRPPQPAAPAQAPDRPTPSTARAPQAAPRATARPATAPAAALDGTLSITSQPAGARVTVNGIGWGETPLRIRHLDFGQKRIRVTMQGYVSEERVARLTPGEPNASARFVLRRRSPAPAVASALR